MYSFSMFSSPPHVLFLLCDLDSKYPKVNVAYIGAIVVSIEYSISLTNTLKENTVVGKYKVSKLNVFKLNNKIPINVQANVFLANFYFQ